MLYPLRDCDHGLDYTSGLPVLSEPFTSTPFPHVFVTCNQCHQSEILPDLLLPEDVASYRAWEERMVPNAWRAYYGPSNGY